jgi:tetratricopeptide (TPR) repeat protein
MDIAEYYDKIAAAWPQPGKAPTQEIEDLCLAAVADHPEVSVFWYDLGVVMQRCGEDCRYTAHDYLQCFGNAVKFDAKDPEAYQELGYVLDVYFARYDKAVEAFRKAIELGAGHESYYGLARVLAQMGKQDEATACLSENNCPFHDHPEIKELISEIVDGIWHGGPATLDEQ